MPLSIEDRERLAYIQANAGLCSFGLFPSLMASLLARGLIRKDDLKRKIPLRHDRAIITPEGIAALAADV